MLCGSHVTQSGAIFGSRDFMGSLVQLGQLEREAEIIQCGPVLTTEAGGSGNRKVPHGALPRRRGIANDVVPNRIPRLALVLLPLMTAHRPRERLARSSLPKSCSGTRTHQSVGQRTRDTGQIRVPTQRRLRCSARLHLSVA